MIEVKKPAILSYHPDMDGDPLLVEKGYCHYSHEGTKDFLDYIVAYQPESDGVSFEVTTFRGAKVGMTLEEITAIYGENYALDYDTAFYANGDLEPQIMFFFDMETWECIGWMLFRNMVI